MSTEVGEVQVLLEQFVERSRYAAEAQIVCTFLTPSISEGPVRRRVM
ncbi:hypothetical protein SAMN04487962_1663, partial [Marinobacter segnicrescens]